jgi:hypothetical protein
MQDPYHEVQDETAQEIAAANSGAATLDNEVGFTLPATATADTIEAFCNVHYPSLCILHIAMWC